MLTSDLAPALQALKERHLYRSRRVIDGPQGASVQIDGKRYFNFCSNDYLGFANHPDLIRAMQRGAEHYGTGSGSAHLVCGHSAAHHGLEEELADFTGRERALLFSTGYMANVGVISALLGRGDRVFEDRLNHASLIDGGLLSGAKFQRYPHADVAALAQKISSTESNRQLIVTDGVFSMDGDLAPLLDLAALAEDKSCGLMVDDAHGFGVLGRTGGGLVQHLNLSSGQVPILVGTFGKALGTFGAFVAGDDALIESVIQKARAYIYTTAPPPAVVEATRASLRLCQRASEQREKLQQLILQFRTGAEQLGLSLMPSQTPIQPLLVPGNEQVLAASEQLLQQRILVSAIRSPTVPKGQERLRITLTAAHQPEHVECLLDVLGGLPALKDAAA